MKLHQISWNFLRIAVVAVVGLGQLWGGVKSGGAGSPVQFKVQLTPNKELKDWYVISINRTLEELDTQAQEKSSKSTNYISNLSVYYDSGLSNNKDKNDWATKPKYCLKIQTIPDSQGVEYGIFKTPNRTDPKCSSYEIKMLTIQELEKICQTFRQNYKQEQANIASKSTAPPKSLNCLEYPYGPTDAKIGVNLISLDIGLHTRIMQYVKALCTDPNALVDGLRDEFCRSVKDSQTLPFLSVYQAKTPPASKDGQYREYSVQLSEIKNLITGYEAGYAIKPNTAPTLIIPENQSEPITNEKKAFANPPHQNAETFYIFYDPEQKYYYSGERWTPEWLTKISYQQQALNDSSMWSCIEVDKTNKQAYFREGDVYGRDRSCSQATLLMLAQEEIIGAYSWMGEKRDGWAGTKKRIQGPLDRNYPNIKVLQLAALDQTLHNALNLYWCEHGRSRYDKQPKGKRGNWLDNARTVLDGSFDTAVTPGSPTNASGEALYPCLCTFTYK